MTEPTQDITLAQATILLTRYGFEMKGFSPQELIDKWLKDYSAKWIRTAIIEALYQGRYKAISVEQILKLWKRRKQMTCHFTHEFERLICRNLPIRGASSLKSSKEISDSPKMAERKIQTKLFNPPLINQETRVIEPQTQQPNPENHPTNQSISFPLKAVNEKTDVDLATVTNNSSDYSNESLSVNSTPQPHLTDSSEEDNELSGAKTVNNSHELKVTLTNVDELFSQFLADNDPQNKSPSVFYSDLDPTYQWRDLIPGRAIDEFTPQLDSSELYSKLKAVVRQELET